MQGKVYRAASPCPSSASAERLHNSDTLGQREAEASNTAAIKKATVTSHKLDLVFSAAEIQLLMMRLPGNRHFSQTAWS